jgi:hypothetical protein
LGSRGSPGKKEYSKTGIHIQKNEKQLTHKKKIHGFFPALQAN